MDASSRCRGTIAKRPELEVCRSGEEGDLGYVWCGEGDEQSGHQLGYGYGTWGLGDLGTYRRIADVRVRMKPIIM